MARTNSINIYISLYKSLNRAFFSKISFKFERITPTILILRKKEPKIHNHKIAHEIFKNKH